MLVVIRGAGDLASGIALRLWRSGISLVMTDLPAPLAIRRSVSFCEAIRTGCITIENVTAKLAGNPEEAIRLLEAGFLPVLADPQGRCIPQLKPDAVVDAILAKGNLGTNITDAPVVIGIGPGFTAGQDCHAVVETMRGHTLGRVIYNGSALPNTNIPGLIGGYAGERVLRTPAAGIFRATLQIGDLVQAGDTAGFVGEAPVICTLSGVLRGLLADGTPVTAGLKCGDIDPRGDVSYCSQASDKALSVGGGVLEALLHLTGTFQNRGAAF